MGDLNQIRFIEQHAPWLKGPFLEVGAKDYGSTQDLKAVLKPGGAYVRIDREEGAHVDLVLDLCQPIEEVDAALDHRRFGTIFCLSVLEHCEQPFVMADRITRLLKPEGKVCISVPFAWKFHAYPSDYWRFTHEGIKLLFPGLSFDLTERAACATSKANDFSPVHESLGRIPLSSKSFWKKGQLIRGLVARMMKGIFRLPYVLAPTSVMMIGTRKPGGESEPSQDGLPLNQ